MCLSSKFQLKMIFIENKSKENQTNFDENKSKLFVDLINQISLEDHLKVDLDIEMKYFLLISFLHNTKINQ